jgi:hypothetical protein
VLAALAFVIFGTTAIRGARRRSQLLPFLAGERSDRLSECRSLGVLHEGDNVAAPAAAATVPDLLSGIDAEAIATAARRTGAGIFAAADALEAGAEAHGFTEKVGLARLRDGVGEDHRMPRSRE